MPGTVESSAGGGEKVASFRLGYRPALDGLRAIAVLLVMLHHSAAFLWPSSASWLATGGFIGVDVFFVLSGLLITVILLESGLVDSTKPLGPLLGSFYLRRIRRLLPALVVLLGFLVVSALVFDTPAVRVALSTIGWVLSYLGNWVVASRPFAPEVSHTWSLSIEGQFYLIWPIVLLGLSRLFPGRTRAAAAIFAFAGILSVILWRAWIWSEQHNSLSLYVRTPARFDALLVGCLAGLGLVGGWFQGRSDRFWRLALVSSGSALLLVAFWVDVRDALLYEGLLTLVAGLSALVTLGALYAGQDFVVTRYLASRPLVAVGRWSYSLYLWHFPLFYLLRQHQPDWPAPLSIVIGWTLAFTAAILSYRFIESPFLRRRTRHGQALGY